MVLVFLTMEIEDRIRMRMKELGLRAVDVAQRTNLSKATLSLWLNGRTSPRGDNLMKLCRVLACSPEWIQLGAEGNEPKSVAIGPETKGLVPIISWVQAGAWREMA